MRVNSLSMKNQQAILNFSSLTCSSSIGEVPEWPKGADCKSAGSAFGGSNPPLSTSEFCKRNSHYMMVYKRGNSSVGRASAFQAEGRGFESRFPLQNAHVAQLAEHILGKDEVTGSIPVMGSMNGIE